MRAIVVYESMYGNTRRIAEAVARGLDVAGTVKAISVTAAGALNAGAYELVVVGGPTHMHGMSRASTRQAAEGSAAASSGEMITEPDAVDRGIREWVETLHGMTGKAAAFDTRFHGAALLTGRASKSIAKRLQKSGFTMICVPESFLVNNKDPHLLPGEEARAEAWGKDLAERTSVSR